MRAYLAIEYVRYEDRLRVREDVDDKAKAVLVPPFLLQPIFENIVKHAVAKQSQPVNVTLGCHLADGDLTVLIEDDGPGLNSSDAHSCGTGLRNLRQRLRLLYGPRASVTVTDRSPRGLKVDIRFKAGSLDHA
jgi:LytS/YehU family sensor histidine kinase